jgi:predicted small secreted protein
MSSGRIQGIRLTRRAEQESMMIRTAAAGLAMMVLAACATPSGAGKPVAKADTIRFSAGPCFGVCPVYSVTVDPKGSGVLMPQKNTAVPGETRFAVTPLQYRRLREAFAPFRPLTGEKKRIAHGENCTRAATDMPGYEIVWTRAGREKTELDFYSGCFDQRYAKLRTAVQSVPRILDIEKMLKAGQ